MLTMPKRAEIKNVMNQPAFWWLMTITVSVLMALVVSFSVYQSRSTAIYMGVIKVMYEERVKSLETENNLHFTKYIGCRGQMQAAQDRIDYLEKPWYKQLF